MLSFYHQPWCTKVGKLESQVWASKCGETIFFAWIVKDGTWEKFSENPATESFSKYSGCTFPWKPRYQWRCISMHWRVYENLYWRLYKEVVRNGAEYLSEGNRLIFMGRPPQVLEALSHIWLWNLTHKFRIMLQSKNENQRSVSSLIWSTNIILITLKTHNKKMYTFNM